MSDFEQRLSAIEARNRKVEADKAWETSWTRVGLICTVTYCFAVLFLYVIGAANFWLGAMVPTAGFFLSTRSLPVVKKWWLARQRLDTTV